MIGIHGKEIAQPKVKVDAFKVAFVPRIMIKTLRTALVALLLPVGTIAAQAIDPYPSDKIPVCELDVFANVVATSCVGFFDKNANKGGAGSSLTSEMKYAMDKFGLPNTGVILEKVDYSGKSADGNFSTVFYGWTVVGYHWGNYPEPGKTDKIGNVTAYYLFDAGTTGITDLGLLKAPGGLSNGVVLYTSKVEGSIVAPEPSVIALLAFGLSALLITARFRKASSN